MYEPVETDYEFIEKMYNLDWYFNFKQSAGSSRFLVTSNRSGKEEIYLYDNELILLGLGFDYTTGTKCEWLSENEFIIAYDPNGAENYYFYLYNITKGTSQVLLESDEGVNSLVEVDKSSRSFYYRKVVGDVSEVHKFDIEKKENQPIFAVDYLFYTASFNKDYSMMLLHWNKGGENYHGCVDVVDLNTMEIIQNISNEEPSELEFVDFFDDENRLLMKTNLNGYLLPVIYSLETREFENFQLKNYDYQVYALLENNKSILLSYRSNGSDHLLLYNLKETTFKEFEHNRATIRSNGKYGKISETEVVVLQSTPMLNYNMYKLDIQTGEIKALIEPKYQIDKADIPQVKHVFCPNDTVEVPAMVFLPTTYDENKRYPAIVAVHGGPWVSVGFDFIASGLVFTKLGYFVIYPNYRGSSEYGKKWMQSLENHIGEYDLSDVNACRRYLLENYPVDTGRVCIWGASYGGYMSMYAITQNPEYWRAAQAAVGVSDWKLLIETGNSFIKRRFTQMFGGESEDFYTKMAKASPITYADKVKTPLILLHDKNDSRVVVDHSRMFYQKLRDMGNLQEDELVLIEFDDTGHMGSTKNDQWAKELKLSVQFFEKFI